MRGGPNQGQLYNMIIYDTNTSYIKYYTLAIIAEFRRPEGPPSRAPYPYRKLHCKGIACSIARGTGT